MPAKLTVLHGRQAGNELALEGKAVFDVGSAPGPAGFKLEGPGIAANHIRIFREDRKFTLFDLNGQGVSVNGQKVQRPTILNDGDEIAIGDVALKFLASASAAPSTSKLGAADDLTPNGHSRPVSEAIDSPALLYCLEGTDKGKVWPLELTRDKFTMGRGVTADVVIMDIKCSREHCRIERRGSEYVAVDLGSTNGTKVNGTKMKPNSTQTLKWGDQVRVGYSTLELRAAAAAGATAPTAKLNDRDRLAAPPPMSATVPPPSRATAPPVTQPQHAAPPPTPRPSAPVPPAQVVAQVPKPMPTVAKSATVKPSSAPLPPSPPAVPATPRPSSPQQDITFDFGPPPPVILPSRTATTDHIDDDDDEAGKAALRTFVFDDQPKDFASVDRTSETEQEKKRPAPPPPAGNFYEEPPLDDYADYLPTSTPPPIAPPPPPPPPPSSKKKKIDEEQPEERDPALRTFVFDEAPSFDDKKPEPEPEPEEAPDPALRTFVFDEAPSFEEKKPEPEEQPDPALRTFVFDESPDFEEPKKGANAKKPAAPPPPPPKSAPPKPATKTPKKPADDDEDRPVEFRTLILDDDLDKKKDEEGDEPPDPTLRTFVFDNPPEF